eukprot:GFUD01006314.1.p1 GENE.GFUD01006314.1~~GFUD01006314.1.p1  ORF type:complete len:183 (-),score=28.05 GFUD01006314.1:250-798(-)
MAVFERCCCCRVRTACLLFGALILIGSIFAIGRDVKEILANEDFSHQELQQVLKHLNMENMMTAEQLKTFFTTDFYTTIADLILAIVMVIVSGVLLYGVHKAIARFLVPILVLIPFDFLIRFIFVCVHSFNLGFLSPLLITMNVACSIGMIFDIFLWLCIFSHWQQINDELVGQDDNEIRRA